MKATICLLTSAKGAWVAVDSDQPGHLPNNERLLLAPVFRVFLPFPGESFVRSHVRPYIKKGSVCLEYVPQPSTATCG